MSHVTERNILQNILSKIASEQGLQMDTLQTKPQIFQKSCILVQSSENFPSQNCRLQKGCQILKEMWNGKRLQILQIETNCSLIACYSKISKSPKRFWRQKKKVSKYMKASRKLWIEKRERRKELYIVPVAFNCMGKQSAASSHPSTKSLNF